MENAENVNATWMEMRKDPKRVKEAVENKLARYYRFSDDNKKRLYHSPGKVFHTATQGEISLYVMGNSEPWDSIVIEYDDGEDGDQFHPCDYDSLDALVAAMIAEIEG